MQEEREPHIDKFAFVGPASVGKTTITEIYRSRFANNPYVAVLEEGAHQFFLANPRVGKGPIHVLEVQEQIQKFVLEKEQSAYKPGVRVIICDRSVVDPIVYAQFYLDNAQSVERLFNNVRGWLPTYSVFFLLDPADVLLEAGQFRKEKPDERLAIFEAFGEFLAKHSFPYKVISGSVQERVAKVDTILYQHVANHKIFNKTNEEIVRDSDSIGGV